MKNLVLLLIVTILPNIAYSGCIGPVIMGECKGTVTPYETNGGAKSNLRPNVYGPGIHQNQYGQPVTVEPDGGSVYGEQLQIKPDAYGPGVHMDQYGRPVREKPWP